MALRYCPYHTTAPPFLEACEMYAPARTLGLIAPLLLLALVGCSNSAPSGATTLAATKSPAQLLRNEITSRIPADMITGDVVQGDASEACDGKGLVRSWSSTADVPIAASATSELAETTEAIVDSFVDQGWKASTRDASSRLFEHRLTGPNSSADVRITADVGNDEGEGASVLVVVNGPCVVTQGPDSDEVKQLEARD